MGKQKGAGRIGIGGSCGVSHCVSARHHALCLVRLPTSQASVYDMYDMTSLVADELAAATALGLYVVGRWVG